MIATVCSACNIDCLRRHHTELLPPGGSTDYSSDPTTEQCESSRMRTGSTVHTLLSRLGWNGPKHIGFLMENVIITNRRTKCVRKTAYVRNEGGTNESGTFDSSIDCSLISPLSAIVTRLEIMIIRKHDHLGVPFIEPQRSIKYTTSIPSNIVPNATSLPSR